MYRNPGFVQVKRRRGEQYAPICVKWVRCYFIVCTVLVGSAAGWVPIVNPQRSIMTCWTIPVQAYPSYSYCCTILLDQVGAEDTEPKIQIAVSDRFHDDMRRVLDSRRHFLSIELLNESMERRMRPVILESDLDGAQRVLTMLRRLQEIGAATELSFQIVIEAFLRRKRIRWKDGSEIVCAADQIESLFEELLQLQPGASLSLETYMMVLQAYAICATPRGDRDYANRADMILQRMEAIFGHISVDYIIPVLHAYAWQQPNLQEGICAARASALLKRVEKLTDDPEILIKALKLVLEAWSKSGSQGSAEQADHLLCRIKDFNERLPNEATTILDVDTYSNAILAWAKATEVGSSERAHELLLEMVSQFESGVLPQHSENLLIAFNGVIASWSRRGRSDKAEEILWLMNSFRRKCDSLVPDSVTYNSVLHAHLKHPNKDEGLEKARQLVQYMEDNCQEQPSIKPNSFTYNTLLKCWIQSRHPDMAIEAERTLLKLEYQWERGDVSNGPNNRIYNMVINAYAKSKHPVAGQKALALLERMKASEGCQPDIISYTSVIECLSKSIDRDAAAKAQSLLQEAFDIYNNSKDPRLLPNTRTFTMAILTIANNMGSPLQARQLLCQLIELFESTQNPNLQPNEYTFNYVLNSAANAIENRSEAFQIAAQTYQDMRKSSYVRPDSFTYAFWLKCCNNLLPEGELRAKCVMFAIDECKRDGLLTSQVLTRLIQGNLPELVGEVLELDPPTRSHYRQIKVEDLPPAWSRNIKRIKRKQ